MKNKGKILGIIILVTAFIFSIGIINSSSVTNEKDGVSIKSNQNPFLDFDSKKEGRKFVLGKEETQNLTESVAEAYANEIKQKNPGGITKDNQKLKVPSLKTLKVNTSKVTEEIKKVFDKDKFTEDNIKVYDKDSKENQKKYLESVINISGKNFEKFDGSVMNAIDELINNQNDADLKKYISAASDQINDLLKIKTTKSLKDFHLKNINLWHKKVSVFYALIEFNNDPLKSMVAIEKIPELIEESSNLQSNLSKKIKELNIVL